MLTFGNGAQCHGVIDGLVAVFGGDVDVQPVHAIAFAQLDGSAHLGQIAVKVLQVQRCRMGENRLPLRNPGPAQFLPYPVQCIIDSGCTVVIGVSRDWPLR